MTGRTDIGRGRRQGFALLAVLAVLAVAAILAGVLGPLIYRQMMEARRQDTLEEMNALQRSLLDFLADTGRFPTEAEGLAALATDPGAPGWQGPYLVGRRYAPLAELATDAFGQAYAYDLDPNTVPAAVTGVILASAGLDGTFTAGSVNGAWSLAEAGDDILVLVDAGITDRDKTAEALQEMQALGDAARRFYRDHTAFPSTTADLEHVYLDAGFSGDALRDPWLTDYLWETDPAAQPPVLVLRSLGPNRGDDDGAGDDLTLTVDSVGPGRSATLHMLAIAQTALDSRPATALTGDWAIDRAALDLVPAFAADGWGRPYAVAVSSRTVLSAGPDGDYLTAGDNLPAGAVPDAGGGAPAWDPHGLYAVGDQVSHGGAVWQCLIAHQGYGDPNWAPGLAPSLWGLVE